MKGERGRVISAALEPEWEARFESRSCGFRPGRGCQDAIQAIYVTARGASCKRPWVLDPDLAAAFDRIDHDHLLASLGTFPARGLVRQWLKVWPSRATSRRPRREPQGRVIGPVLLIQDPALGPTLLQPVRNQQKNGQDNPLTGPTGPAEK